MRLLENKFKCFRIDNFWVMNSCGSKDSFCSNGALGFKWESNGVLEHLYDVQMGGFFWDMTAFHPKRYLSFERISLRLNGGLVMNESVPITITTLFWDSKVPS